MVHNIQNAKQEVRALQQTQERQDLRPVPGKRSQIKAVIAVILRGAALTSSLSKASLKQEQLWSVCLS